MREDVNRGLKMLFSGDPSSFSSIKLCQSEFVVPPQPRRAALTLLHGAATGLALLHVVATGGDGRARAHSGLSKPLFMLLSLLFSRNDARLTAKEWEEMSAREAAFFKSRFHYFTHDMYAAVPTTPQLSPGGFEPREMRTKHKISGERLGVFLRGGCVRECVRGARKALNK